MFKSGALLFGLMLATTSHVAVAGSCDAAVKKALKNLDLEQDAIFIEMESDSSAAPDHDYLYWYTLRGCETTGYLNVRITNACYIQGIFTRYGCDVPGLRHFNW